MKEDKQGKYTRGDLVATMMDFFTAGTETSSTTLKWTLLYLATNQVQVIKSKVNRPPSLH